MARPGRRPGEARTRGAIIDAARAEFLERGYNKVTLRGIARRAGVDPSLIYHYFPSGKADLFVATTDLPMDPRRVKEQAQRRAPGRSAGAEIVKGFLHLWEGDGDRSGAKFAAILQAVVSSPAAARGVREFLRERVGGGSGAPSDDPGHALVGSQLVGLAWARYVLRIEPIASAPVDAVAELVGPTVDRYLGQPVPEERPGRTPGGVYLAGPSGFFEAGRLWHETVLVPKVVAAGLVPKDPWADQKAITNVMEAMEYGAERRAALREASLVQGRLDLRLIDDSEAILASLDGQDVDSGTALEIGYGFARGLLIVGLRTDIRASSDVEGGAVNLMVETCVADSGGIVTSSVDEAVRFIAERLGVTPKRRTRRA